MAKDDKTQTTQGAADSFLGPALDEANRIYQATASGKSLTKMNNDTRSALQTTRNLSNQPVQGLAEANQFNTGLIGSGGWTDDLRQAQGFLMPFADGSLHEDPRMKELLDTNANRATNGAATRFGGGRYGSAAIGQGVGNAVADANNGIMLQSNENGRNRQLQASGLLGQMGESARGAAMQATSQIPMLDNAKYAGAERRAGVGDYLTQRLQNPNAWQNAQTYAGLLGSLGGQRQIQTIPNNASGAQKAIGGASTGAVLGSMLGPWGTAIGGVGGGLLGSWG
jgi:hypothetical protein